MNTETAVATVGKLESAFLEAFRRGLDALEEAGKLLVELTTKDAGARARLVQEHGFDHGTLTTLEKIGSGVLYARLAAFGTRYAGLPMSEQKRLADGKVEAVVTKPDGTSDILKVSLLRTTPELREQIVNRDDIRTVDEQRAWLLAKANTASRSTLASKPDSMPWRVAGKQIDILRPVKLTRSDLVTMMRSLEG